jgi:hypothetical protein
MTKTQLTETDLEFLIDACMTAVHHHEHITIPKLREEDVEMLVELGYEPDESFVKVIANIESVIEHFKQLQRKLDAEIEALP